jgi:uncharacterized membrane protein
MSRPLLTLEELYALAGAILAYIAARIAIDREHPRRWGSAAFWGLLAAIFIFGKTVPPVVIGYAIVAMAFLAVLKQVGRSPRESASRNERAAEAGRLGNRVFVPALLIPLTAIIGALTLPRIHFGATPLVDPKQATLIALGLGALVALGVGLWLLGARVTTPAREGGRLLETVGWTLLLPQLLAALGGIFQHAGVGNVVADLVVRAVPVRWPFIAVVTYCLGMAVFTMCMGNAFAAFAVITGGIGLPLIVQQHHGNPAIMAAIGMLCGYCGTLLTPMAANFNLVPAMLLELSDKNAVIKAQIPIGLTVLAANIGLMYFCVYRF